ncbi:MAG: Rne/Rng family ribonuclease [Planctomycetota bacterium]
MLINFVPGEECRIAIVEDGKLEEYYQERASAESHVSNIYKGRVTNIEPAIQAAFVDFGLERNGFLHTSDLHPKYFPGKDREAFEKVGKKTARRDRPPIQKCLKRGDEVLVQVLKEGIGTKGPTLTSYLSIPGRFLVMMPDMQQLGVSRKVEDDEARKETRKILKELDPPKEFGFIARTAAIGQTKTDIKRDLSYLVRLWKNIERNRKKIKRTGELYAESDLVIRTIRDVFTTDIEKVIVDDLTAARRAEDFLRVASPRTKTQVLYYDDPVPLFHRKGVETQIELITAREVPLPSGGALVIDQTEALVAIDVNSGKSRGARDAETNALNTNLEAVDEICRQLRLRDLGGIVVNDLIDMRPARNRKKVEQRMRDNLKKDRAKTRIGPISTFGLLEMTRQRMRPSLKKSTHTECRHCRGLGYTLSAETVVLAVMRRLALVMQRQDVTRVELTISPDVAFQLLNRKRGELTHLEETYDKPVLVRVGGGSIDYINIAAFDKRNQEVDTGDIESLKNLRPPSDSTYRQTDDPELPETLTTVVSSAEEEAEATDTQASPVKAQGDPTADGEGESAEEDGGGKKKRRRRRRRRRKSGDETAESEQGVHAASEEGDADPEPTAVADGQAPVDETDDTDQPADAEDGEAPKKKRRRRRRGGRGRGKRAEEGEAGPEGNDAAEAAASIPDADQDDAEQATAGDARVVASGSEAGEPDASEASADQAPDEATKRKRRRRRRRKSDTSEEASDPVAAEHDDSSADQDETPDEQELVIASVTLAESDLPKADEGQGSSDGDSAGTDDGQASSSNKPSMRRKVRKRNAPPPPGSQGYSNSVAQRRDDA